MQSSTDYQREVRPAGTPCILSQLWAKAGRNECKPSLLLDNPETSPRAKEWCQSQWAGSSPTDTPTGHADLGQSLLEPVLCVSGCQLIANTSHTGLVITGTIQKLSSDLHTRAVAHVYPYSHIIYTYNKNKNKFKGII